MYEENAEKLILNCFTDHVRVKFKNIRSYFYVQKRKIRNALSGSAGSPALKWRHFDAASFLTDVHVDQAFTKANFELPTKKLVSYKLF